MSCFKILVSVYRKLTKVTNSVGGRKRTSIAYTGSNGLNYAVQKFRVLGRKGFRDMEKFKLAMLAKQGWWLIQYPSSLLAQVWRGKYYPHGNFWKLNWVAVLLILGRVYLLLNLFFREGFDGEWVMVSLFACGMINGCQNQLLSMSSHQSTFCISMLKCVNWLIMISIGWVLHCWMLCFCLRKLRLSKGSVASDKCRGQAYEERLHCLVILQFVVLIN